jgi:GH25 family lysozyme M1 (1,4-beta-N-acetylmuramidase)
MNDRRALAPYPPIQPEVGRPGYPAQPKPAPIPQALRRGDWDTAVRLAMGTGVTDISQLTDILFYVLHPELRGKRIDSNQRSLGREWIDIRDRRVRPVLESRGRSPAGASAGATAQPGSVRTFFGVDTAGGENENADWLRAKAQVPIDFAIIRATGGILVDECFGRTWPKLKDAGIVRGAYLFLVFPKKGRRPSNPAVQVETYIKTVPSPDASDLPPILDVEADNWQNTGMSPRQLLDYVRGAWKALRDHYGVAPIIYTSYRVWREVLGDLPAPDLAESPLWLKDYYRPFAVRQARYDPQSFAGGRYNPRMPAHWGDAMNWWIHQYQGDARGLPGFSSTVDMNRFNTTVRGAAGDRVRWVQRRLGIPQSGVLDAATERALRIFQNSKGIDADGVINPRTFAYLCWSTPNSASPSR